MVTVYINRWGIKIPALLYCYPSKTKGPEYFFLSLSILLFSIIDKAIMQHSDSHHLVEVNLHRYQLLLNLTLLPSLPKLMLQLPQSSWTLAHEISAAVNIIPLFYQLLATVYKGNIIKNLIMDCQSYTKYRPNETTGGIFVSWRRKEELLTGAWLKSWAPFFMPKNRR